MGSVVVGWRLLATRKVVRTRRDYANPSKLGKLDLLKLVHPHLDKQVTGFFASDSRPFPALNNVLQSRWRLAFAGVVMGSPCPHPGRVIGLS